ncbi:MAG: ABC transporter ATP-binding protein [Actinomycetota bacterium]
MGSVPILVCRDLRKAYGDRVAVGGVSFDVAPGEAFGLLGPNGAGKTTTIKMVCGLLKPDSGEVLIGGRRIDDRAADRRALGYVPHELALYPELTAHENLSFWGRLEDLRGAALGARIASVLETVDLRERAHDRVKEFSSGMQRRLNLAVALLGEPRLLVLDEPTVGVDPQSRGGILDRLGELRENGVALLYASHYIDEIERFCDSVAIIDHGSMIAYGTPTGLIRSLGAVQRLEIGATGNVGAFVSAAFAIAEVEEAKLVNGTVRLAVRDAAAAIPMVVKAAEDLDVSLFDIQIAGANLEAVFLHLTGRTMRD